MKILSFLKWKIKQATIADWLWGLGCALIGAGVVRYDIDGKFYMLAGATLWLTILFFEIVIRGIKRDYNLFVQEQNNLFNTIKNSDKND